MMHAVVHADVRAIADRVRSARAAGGALRIVGAGTWLDAGRPCAAEDRLALDTLRGIVAYEPGDLTLTARAGTSMAEIARVTAAEGQWLTLDAGGSSRGTIGATVATASSGPLASAFGTPRDHVLGCEFVSGTGDVVRAGGRVVKNVAGFDLVRLVTGAWGTLGALTELTVRLRARPEEDVTLAVRLADASAEQWATRAWRFTREGPFTPLAAELLSPALAQRVLGSREMRLLVRLGGNTSFVRAATAAVTALGDAAVVTTDVWHALARAEPAEAIVFRVSTLPSRLGPLVARLTALAEAVGGDVQATLVRGVVRCVLPVPRDADGNEHLRAELTRLATEATVVGERLPAALWNCASRSAATGTLPHRLRGAFDPDGVLNPGLLGGA